MIGSKLLTTLSPHAQAIKLAAIGVGLLALVASTAKVTADIYQGRIDELKLGYVEAEKKAVELALARQKAQNEIDKNAAVNEAEAQTTIVERTHTITEKVPVYVPVSTKCPVTAGFIRVLDAAVLGVSPGDIPLPAGQSDDSCAAVDPRTLALNIVANYGTCHANAQQLTSLQDWLKATTAASKKAAGQGRAR